MGRFGIYGVRRTRDDLTLGPHDELVADAVRREHGVWRTLWVDDDLAETAAIAQIDEHEAAVIAAGVDPTGEHEALTDVPGPHLAAHELPPRGRLAHPSRTSAIRSIATRTGSSSRCR